MDETPAAAPSEPAVVLATEPPSGKGNHWLREATVILVSVALGFAASEFGQYRQERGLARAVLRSMTEKAVRDDE